MAQETRIYVVTDTTVDETAAAETRCNLIRAGNPAQAVRAVTKDRFMVEVASQDDLVRLMTAGVTVEESKADAE